MITGIPMTTNSSLYRLLAWLSPSFPVGAFSYSHGLEYAVEIELVKSRDDLVAWIATLLRHGSGLHDAMLFVAAWRALDEKNPALLTEIFELSSAMRPTSELALETQAQGAAFARAIRDAWPHPALAATLPEDYVPSYPLIVAQSAHAHGIGMRDALVAYLHAFTANLISAGVRLIPLGQTDGQIALRLLEPDVTTAADLAESLPLSELGSATPMLDFCSARHETQYTRLFRS
jgi:urease accessory protein